MTEWNPDVDALARKMWEDGLPASKIPTQLAAHEARSSHVPIVKTGAIEK